MTKQQNQNGLKAYLVLTASAITVVLLGQSAILLRWSGRVEERVEDNKGDIQTNAETISNVQGEVRLIDRRVIRLEPKPR